MTPVRYALHPRPGCGARGQRIATVINLAAFGMPVSGHPVGAALRAKYLMAIDAGGRAIVPTS